MNNEPPADHADREALGRIVPLGPGSNHTLVTLLNPEYEEFLRLRKSGAAARKRALERRRKGREGWPGA